MMLSTHTSGAFATLDATHSIQRTNEHDGTGAIEFRRMFEAGDFASPIDFVDVTLVPPGSSIGRHMHLGSEEFYVVLDGTPLVTVDGVVRRLSRGAISLVRSGGQHELVNDTTENVMIGVVQVRVAS